MLNALHELKIDPVDRAQRLAMFDVAMDKFKRFKAIGAYSDALANIQLAIQLCPIDDHIAHLEKERRKIVWLVPRKGLAGILPRLLSGYQAVPE